MKKQKKEVNLIINFTDGWQERVTKTSYELYVRVENEKKEKQTV